MSFRNLLRAAAVAAVAVVATASAHAASWKLAVTDVEGLERLQTEWGPFKAALEKATGDSFEFFPVNSRTAAAEALRSKRVDFVVSGPAEYVVINKLTKADALIGLGRPDYFCGIIVRADSPYHVPADLKGKKIAFDDIGSTSGHLCPMQLLKDYGVDPVNDIERVHTSRNVAHEALKKGDVQAMGANYNSWISKARAKDTSVAPGFFRVIARSGDLPNDMIMVGAHVPAADVARVRDAILGARQDIIAAILAHPENDKYRGMELLAIKDSDYDRVRSMYTTAGFPQFDKFIGD